MRISVANRILACVVALVLAEPALIRAGDGGTSTSSWQNLGTLAAGQEIEVERANGTAVKGAFIGFTDQSVSVRGKLSEIAIPRGDVYRVRLRRAGYRKYAWIGAAIGAGAGAGAGAGLADRAAYQSGGDYAGLKPAIIGLSAGVGALAGALIGTAIGNKRTIVYAKP
jgi:hypothetical protein